METVKLTSGVSVIEPVESLITSRYSPHPVKTSMYNHIEDYIFFNIREETGMSLNEYLELDNYTKRVILDMILEKIEQKKRIMDEANKETENFMKDMSYETRFEPK